MNAVGRLAPTPSGVLHLGNVVAFAAAWLSTRVARGTLLLRVEDIDRTRSRSDIAVLQRQDLEWLGLQWDLEVPMQSKRDYRPFLSSLHPRTYFCQCTRAQVREHGGIYPGTCRHLQRESGAIRFHLESAHITFNDQRFGTQSIDPTTFGDPVLQRRDGAWSYNLAVTADDVADGVTEVVRGADLLEYTAVQIQLIEAVGCARPTYLHAPLILGADKRKLSKSHGSMHIGQLRSAGWSPRDIWRLVLPWLGITEVDHLHEAIPYFRPDGGPLGPIQLLSSSDEGIPTPTKGIQWMTQKERS